MFLADPGWLVALLLVPLLLAGMIVALRQRARRWQRFVAPRLRNALLRRNSPLPRWVSLLSLLGALAALICALARPQGQAGTRTETVRGRNVLIAIDLSRSMLTRDVLPDRLSHAKALAYELLDALPNDRIGAIGFAGSAFRFAPLTIDHNAVRDTIEQLNCDSMPTSGSDLAGAVRAAIETFGPDSRSRNALVILSDGEEHEGKIDGTAVAAAHAGLHIISIGIGTEEGALVPDPTARDGHFRDRRGNTVLSRLKVAPLRAFAEETGGQFVIANAGGNIPAIVRGMCQGLDSYEIANRKRTIHVEFFQWFVLPAILLLITSIVAGTHWRLPRQGAAVALPVLLACGSLTKAHAADVPPDVARPAAAAAASRGERAARFRLEEGTAAFRHGEMRRARSALSQALLAQDPAVQAAAHHNLGVALLESGWRQLSGGEPYPEDPAKAPEQLASFAAARTAEWLNADDAQSAPSAGFHTFESIIISWTDAVRHFDSAVRADATRDDSRHNRELTVRLLKQLQELLRQQADSVESQLPEQPQPNPQGQQDPQNPSEGQQGDEPTPDKQGAQKEPKENKQSDEGPEQPSDKDKPDQQERPQAEQGKADRKPSPDRTDETPAQRARRLLGENADLDKNPMLRHRRYDSFQPEKDW